MLAHFLTVKYKLSNHRILHFCKHLVTLVKWGINFRFLLKNCKSHCFILSLFVAQFVSFGLLWQFSVILWNFRKATCQPSSSGLNRARTDINTCILKWFQRKIKLWKFLCIFIIIWNRLVFVFQCIELEQIGVINIPGTRRGCFQFAHL